MLKISVSICITLIVFVKYLNMSRADSQNKNKGLSRLDGRHEWMPQVADNTDSASTPKRTHSQTSTSSTPQQPSKRVNIDNDSTDELLEFFDNISPLHSDINSDVNQKCINFLKSPFTMAMIGDMVKVAVTQQLETYEHDVSFLKGTVDSLTNMVHCLQDENEKLKSKIVNLETGNDRLEQYSRRQSLRIHNDWPENPEENTDGMVIQMAKEHLNIDLKHDEINRSHRVGPKNRRGSPRPVIVKFVSHNSKARIYRSKGRLKMGGPTARNLLITEDLTKKRHAMFTEARHLRNQNLIRDCWTMDGNLFVRDMHARIQVFSDIMAFSKWKEHLMGFPPQTYSEILNK